MLKHFVLVFFFLFSSTDVFCQSSEIIDLIKKEVGNINKAKLTVKAISGSDKILGEITDGGAELKGYYDKGKLKKITVSIGLSSCKDVYEYFFKDGLLIFVFEEEEGYVYDEAKNDYDYHKLEHLMDARFYFDNDKIIKTIFSGYPRCTKAPREMSNIDIINDCSRYIALLNQKG